MKIEEVLEFVKKHTLAVVATVSTDGKPQAAVVEFGELDDLTIIIDTLKTSRKYKNLQANNNVAIVIGWDEDKTVQIDAISTELKGDELEKAKHAYLAKNPRAKKWANNPDIAYFAFKPTWLRYSDVSQHPWVIEEFSF
jgi:pyridoxine/pyridoxamine 5'-phosphate oxidase